MALGFGLSAFAVVSCYLFVGSCSELVLVLGVPLGCGFGLPYRWFAIGVGFGRSDCQWFRINNVVSRSVLVLGVPLGGGFASIMFASLMLVRVWSCIP